MQNISALAQVQVGQVAGAALAAFLQEVADKAERVTMNNVVVDPDSFGICDYASAREIREEVGVWAQFISVCENGFEVTLNVDADNLGGDSRNEETVLVSATGKRIATNVGKVLATFDGYEFKRES